MSAGVLWVSVKPSLDGFGQALRAQIEASIPPEIKVKVRPDDSGMAADGAAAAGKFADAFRARLDAAMRNLPKVRIDADSSEAEQKLAGLRFDLESLSNKRVGIDIDAASARAELDRIKAALDELARKSPDVEVRVNAGAASAELKAFSAEVDRLDGKTAKVDVDTSSGRQRINALLLAGLSLGPALIPIGAAIAAGLASIGPAAIAAAGALGSIKLAFADITPAISAYDAMQTQAGSNAQSSANAQAGAASQIASAQDGVVSAARAMAAAQAQAADSAISSAEKVANAEQAVANATQNAADAAVASAERIANAQQSLVDAQRSAAQQITSANNSLISAEEALANAQLASTNAQKALTQARVDAAAQLKQNTFSVQDNALAQRAAALQLQQAQLAQRQLGSLATGLQKDQAQLAVDQAQQHIVELKSQGEDLAKRKATDDAKGIEGSDRVVAAQQAVTAAVQRTGDAQRSLAQAQQAVTNAQISGAESIKRAQQGLADAQRASAIQARNSAQAIQSAEQGLADARRAQAMQQLQSANSLASAAQAQVSAQRALESAHRSAAQAMQAGGAAARAYAAALAKLSPAGREFVQFYEAELKPRFDDLKKVAQTGLLPGLEAGIKSYLAGPFGQLKAFIGNTSTALGDLAREAGAALQQPFWHDFFDFMNRIAAPTIKQLAENFGNFITGAAGIMQALYQPVFVPIMDWFTRMAKAVADFGTSAAAGTNGGFNGFLQFVKDTGPTVAAFFGQLFTLIGHISAALAGQGGGVLTVLTEFLRVLNMLPLLVVQALVDFFLAYKVWSAVGGIAGIKGFVSDLAAAAMKAKELWTSLGGIPGILGKIKAAGPGLLKTAGVLAAGYAVGTGLVAAGANNEADPMRPGAPVKAQAKDAADTVGKVLTLDVGGLIDKFKRDWGNLDRDIANIPNGPAARAWRAFSAELVREFETVGRVAHAVWGGISDFLGGIWSGIADVTVRQWGQIGSILSGAWRGISTVAQVSWRFVADLWSATWDGVAGVGRAAWAGISSFFVGAWQLFSIAWSATWSAVSGVWSSAWSGISNIGQSAWAGISSFFTGAEKVFSDAWSATWAALSIAWSATWGAISKTATDAWNACSTALTAGVNAFSSTWSAAWQAVVNTFTTIWNGIKAAAAVPVNFLIQTVYGGGIKPTWDAVAGFVGLGPLPAPPGALAFAGGGVLPGYSPGVDSVRAMLSPGEAVLVPELVRQLGPSNILAANAAASGRPAGSPGRGYAGGGVFGDIWGSITGAAGSAASWVASKAGAVSGFLSAALAGDPAKVFRDLMGGVSDSMGQFLRSGIGQEAAGLPPKMIDGFVTKIVEAVKAVKATMAASFGGVGGPAPPGQVNDWIMQALGLLNYPATYAAGIYHQIQTESGGNPNAIQGNIGDVNNRSGDLAKGIMQVITATFNANALPGHGNIFNPVDNIAAGSHYAMGRYGAGWFADGPQHSHGYDSGGWLMPGVTKAVNATGRPEAVLTADQWRGVRALAGTAASARPIGGADLRTLIAANGGIEKRLDDLNQLLKRRGAGATINVADRSGDPAETARTTMLALRLA